jgi:hypothetical protein
MVFNRYVVSERRLNTKILELKSKGLIPIIDYAVEHSKNIFAFENKFTKLMHIYNNNYFAIKLSAIDFDLSTAERIMSEALKANNRILIDAEEVIVQERINAISDELMIKHHNHIFKTYQMYRKDAIPLLMSDINRYHEKNIRLNIKLVRGAYLHKDKYTGALHETKKDTDLAYDYMVDVLLQNEQHIGEVIFATHNKTSYDKFKDARSSQFSHASLMGFSTPLEWKGRVPKMVYVPFGPFHRTYPYLIRRLYENPFIFSSNNLF